MIKRDSGDCFGNSIIYNPINDDKTLRNYLALAYAIVGIKTENGRKILSVSKICSAFELCDFSETKEIRNNKGLGKTRPNTGKYTNHKIVLEDTKTGEKIIYDNSYPIAERFNKTPSIIATYIKRGRKLNRRYLLYSLEE